MKKLLLTIMLIVFCCGQIFPQTANSDMWITNGDVTAIAVDGNYTYIGGNFTYVGPNTGKGAKLTTTSTVPASNFPKVDGVIRVAVSDADGNWYIGGDFTKVGDLTRNCLARINSDGSVHGWNPNANSTVAAIAISGSDIYVGGTFTTVGGQSRNRLAKLNNTDGTADANWNPNASATVRAIAISVSDIYVGGEFVTVGGQSRNYLAKLNNTDGTADTNWNPNASATVRVIAISGSDIYVGGSFTSMNTSPNSVTRNRLAKLNNTDGTADAIWNPNANLSVHAIVISGSDIYVGGNFTGANSINGNLTRNRLAKLNSTDGTADVNWNPNASGTVEAIAISGSDIYVGGSFSTVGGQNRNRIAKLNNTDGSPEANWNPNASLSVNAIAINGSDIYIGGSFSAVGGQSRNRLAKLNNTDGTADANWNPNASATVRAIAISVSDIYVGGEFVTVGGQSRNYLAKLNNTDGTADANWNPNASSYIYAIAISESDIYVGGSFSTVGGQNRNRLAKLNNTNGTAHASWNPNASSTVNAIAISGSDIYVGGSFTFINTSTTRNRLAKLNNTNGTAVVAWNPDANSTVNAIAISGSDIYVGGGFTSVGGQSRNRLAKLNNTDGTADASWNPNASATVNAIAISGSHIYVGGGFTTVGGQSRNYLAILNNTDGTADAAWDPNASSTVNAIAISGSYIYAGGAFTSMNGYPQPYFAQFVLLTQAPTAQPTNLVFSVSGSDPYNNLLSYTASGSAENYLVVRQVGSAPTFTPSNGTEYTAGAQTGGYVVYSGENTSISDVNITAGSYYYIIFAFNGSGTGTKYLTTNPLSGYTIISTNGSVTVGNTGGNPVSTGFPNAGVNISFPNGVGGTDITVTKTDLLPASNFAALPGVKGMKNLYFTITSSNSSPGNYTLVLDFSSLTGMTEAKWNAFKIMKRANASEEWKDVTGAPYNATILNRQTDGVWGKFTISGLSSFSEFGGGEEATIWTVTSNAETGAGTLKQAITDAAAGDIITFNASMTITLTSTFVIDKDLTIRGVGEGITLDGNGATRVMDIEDAKVARLEKLIVKNGTGDVGYAGGIWNNGDLTLINCVVANNSEIGNTGTGGILQYSDDLDDANDVLNLVNTTITNNSGISGFDDGIGGLSVVTGEVNIYNTIIWGNTGDGYGDVDETYTITKVYNSCIGNLAALGGNISAGANNISSNPEFVGAGNSAAHPYSISGSSPCADAGDDSYCFETTDLKNEGRKLLKTDGGSAGTIDIGAYEYNSNNPLPVELTSFTASVNKNKVVLNWQTATEQNNHGFEIERISNNDNWEKIAFVQGNGNSNSPKEYSFTDESLSSGKYSYRLKQIDTDGKYTYSEVVNVEIENIPTEYTLFQNYPNPFNPSTTIKFGLPEDSKVVLEVYNIIGEKVKTLINQEMSAGYHNVNFTGNELSTGIYIYRITANEFTSTKKFIL
ncbi:MAG TPA: T9SS type A sorting domain-containing protein, partial [Ignavibacteriaceae bacterium]|nr:T9SS type A sorting domain-containing protein [Ignavibacteriaceae bacterium]